MAEGNTSQPIYFWRETTQETGYLSQWYEGAFYDDKEPSKKYKTAEHYMMYQKAILFGDERIAGQILKASHPRKVKELGRKVSNFSEPKWNEERMNIVRQGNLLKFTRPVEPGDKVMLDKLLATGDRELVEASPYDRIWGIGFKEDVADVTRDEWGLNLLGKALMEVRETLRQERVD